MNLKLVIALKRSINRINRDEERLFKEIDLTHPQFGVLEVLYHKGSLRVSQIIDKTLSTGGNMTVIINNLEKDGYITKYRDIADKRAFVISITERGRSVIDEVWPKHLVSIKNKFQRLDSEDKEMLLKLLKKMNGIG